MAAPLRNVCWSRPIAPDAVVDCSHTLTDERDYKTDERSAAGITAPIVNETNASSRMNDRSNQPPSRHLSICASRNLLLNRNSQKKVKYPTSSMDSNTIRCYGQIRICLDSVQ